MCKKNIYYRCGGKKYLHFPTESQIIYRKYFLFLLNLIQLIWAVKQTATYSLIGMRPFQCNPQFTKIAIISFRINYVLIRFCQSGSFFVFT